MPKSLSQPTPEKMSNSRLLGFRYDELYENLDKHLSELRSLPLQTLSARDGGWTPLDAFGEIYRIWYFPDLPP